MTLALDHVVLCGRLLGVGLLGGGGPLGADSALLRAALGVARVALRVDGDETRVGVGQAVEVGQDEFVRLVEEGRYGRGVLGAAQERLVPVVTRTIGACTRLNK